MKVRDFIQIEADIDVYDNVCEELAICMCGAIRLKDEGKEHFADALDMDVTLFGDHAVVDVDDPDDDVWERNLEIAKEFFESAAGYCTVDEYDRWFET